MEDHQVILDKISQGVYNPLKKEGRSAIWCYLHNIQKDDGSIYEGIVYCVKCHKILKYVQGKISNLLKHKCCIEQRENIAPQVVNYEPKKNFFEAFMEFTIEDCRPFNIVEGSGFRKMIKACIQAGSKYGENIDLDNLFPSAQTLSEECKLMAEEKKLELKPRIQQLISNGEAAVTIEMGSDEFVKRSFLCAILHFQEDFKLADITLGMKTMDLICNTPANIRQKLNNFFEELGVADLSKTIFVTDRESNVVGALEDVARLNCSVHLFSNVLNEAFNATHELKEIISVYENIARVFKNLNKDTIDMSLESICPTRWRSYFTMYKSILENYSKINEIINDDAEIISMLNSQMPILQSLVEICTYFESIFKKLQDNKSPTIYLVIPSITRVKAICSFQKKEHSTIAILKRNILIHLEKWSSNLSILHKVALFLHPPSISLQMSEMNEIKAFCLKKLTEMSNTSNLPIISKSDLNDSTMILQSPKTHQPPSSALLPTSSFKATSESVDADASFFFPTLEKASTVETVREEVERYSNENVTRIGNLNVMQWWKKNSHIYPMLSKLAVKILSIPASSIATERFFSLAGNVISQKTNPLDPETIDSILFLNSL